MWLFQYKWTSWLTVKHAYDITGRLTGHNLPRWVSCHVYVCVVISTLFRGFTIVFIITINPPPPVTRDFYRTLYIYIYIQNTIQLTSITVHFLVVHKSSLTAYTRIQRYTEHYHVTVKIVPSLSELSCYNTWNPSRRS